MSKVPKLNWVICDTTKLDHIGHTIAYFCFKNLLDADSYPDLYSRGHQNPVNCFWAMPHFFEISSQFVYNSLRLSFSPHMSTVKNFNAKKEKK